MDYKSCLECGGEVTPTPESGDDVVWCEGCAEYKAFYAETRAAIVSRVLAEEVKDAPKVEAVYDGCQNITVTVPCAGTYALIHVKEDKP